MRGAILPHSCDMQHYSAPLRYATRHRHGHSPLNTQTPATSLGEARESWSARREVVPLHVSQYYTHTVSWALSHGCCVLGRTGSVAIAAFSENLSYAEAQPSTVRSRLRRSRPALTSRLAELEELLRDHASDVVLSWVVLAAPAVAVTEEAGRMFAVAGAG